MLEQGRRGLPLEKRIRCTPRSQALAVDASRDHEIGGSHVDRSPEHHDELFEYSTVVRLYEINERERAQLADGVHDNLLQDIIAADLLLQGCENFDRQRLKANVEKARSSLSLGVQRGRRLIGDLRSMFTDQCGLIGAIEYYAAEIERRSRIRIEVRKDSGPEISAPLWGSNVFRIAQSAMNNVEDHSNADSAIVDITQEEGEFCLTVRDTGVGFDVPSVNDSSGLFCLRERAKILGGSASVDSHVNGGCTVSVRLPLPAAAH